MAGDFLVEAVEAGPNRKRLLIAAIITNVLLIIIAFVPFAEMKQIQAMQ